MLLRYPSKTTPLLVFSLAWVVACSSSESSSIRPGAGGTASESGGDAPGDTSGGTSTADTGGSPSTGGTGEVPAEGGTTGTGGTGGAGGAPTLSCFGVNDTGTDTDCSEYGEGYYCDRRDSMYGDPRTCTCTADGTGALNWVCVHLDAGAGG